MSDAHLPSNPNTGHGHVFPRPYGVRARCGGPGLCAECSLDLSRKNGKASASDPPRVYVFDESEVQEGWPTQYVSMEDYDSLRRSHRNLMKVVRLHGLDTGVAALRDAVETAELPCCLEEHNGGFACTLPKGHVGRHEAWGSNPPRPRFLIVHWPAEQAGESK